MSEGEKKPAKRKFKTTIKCCISFVNDAALEFRRLMDWLIGLLSGPSIYSSGDVPLMLYPDKVEVKTFDADRIMLPHIVLDKYSMSMFLFDAKANSRFSYPAVVILPSNQLGYILEAVNSKESELDIIFKLNYESWCVKRKVEVRKPEVCPICGKKTIFNQLPLNKRGKRGDRYKCICGWRGKVKTKFRTVKDYESKILDNSRVEIEIKGDGKEKFELEPVFAEPSIPEDIPSFRFTAIAKVDRKEFINKLKRIKKLAKMAVFEVKDGDFNILAKEGYVKAGKFELGYQVLLDCRGEAKAGYNIDKMLEAIPPIGDITTLQFADDMPILISANPEYLTSAKIECWQAPVLLEI